MLAIVFAPAIEQGFVSKVFAQSEETEISPEEPSNETASDETAPSNIVAPPTNNDASAAPEAAIEPPALLILDVMPVGIDPIVARIATQELRQVGESMGFRVLSAEDTTSAARTARLPVSPTPADVWRTTWTARAASGVSTRIWSRGSEYVIEILVASTDGRGPLFGRHSSSAERLRENLQVLLRATLPSPASYLNPTNAAPSATQTLPSQDASRRLTTIRPISIRQRLGVPYESASRPGPTVAPRHFSLSLTTDSSIGVSPENFYAHWIGVRGMWRPFAALGFGVYAGYNNLPGRNGRVDNWLLLGVVETRIRLLREVDLALPLRLSIGYMPFNGPVTRLSAGISWAFSPNFDIGIDLLSPTIYFLPDRTAVAMNLAIELGYRF